MAWTQLSFDKANNIFSLDPLKDSVYNHVNGLCYPLDNYYGARQVVRWTLPVDVSALRVYITPSGYQSGTVTVGCYHIENNEDWDNSTLTWNNSTLVKEATLLGSVDIVGSSAYLNVTMDPFPSAGALSLWFEGIGNAGAPSVFAEGGVIRIEYEETPSSGITVPFTNYVKLT